MPAVIADNSNPRGHPFIRLAPALFRRTSEEACLQFQPHQAIATDMIRLAWEKAYDVAVLASSDGDLVPAVEFLDDKGSRIIQAGFPPHGSHLARACWGSFDMFALRESFRQP